MHISILSLLLSVMLLISPALTGKHGGKKYDVKCHSDDDYKTLPPSELFDIYTKLLGKGGDIPCPLCETILKVEAGRAYSLDDTYIRSSIKVCITNKFIAYGTTVSYAEIGRGIKRIYEKCCDKRDDVMCGERQKAQITGRDGLYLDLAAIQKGGECEGGPVDFI
ncbi:MAG: hypothetical protein Q9226_004158 [Calogaya cf. arnoldii]